jgi:hypothetical protein
LIRHVGYPPRSETAVAQAKGQPYQQESDVERTDWPMIRP